MIPLLIGVAVLIATIWLWTLVDVLSWPSSTWAAAGLSRSRWVMRACLLGLLGTVLYLRGPRRELRAAYEAIRWGA